MKLSQGRINWAFLVVLVLAVAVVAGTAVWLRHWNRSGRASAGLKLGNEAFAAENWNEAASQYGRYLGVKQDDVEILIKYAKAQLNRTPPKKDQVTQAINSLSIALRQDAAKCSEAQRREAANLLVDIYIQVGMAGEAEVKAAEQLKIIADQDLQRKMAFAFVQQKKFPQAVEALTALIGQDATDILSYSMLAQVAEQKPADVKVLPSAEKLYEEMVAKNPAAAQAYTIRARYWLHIPNPDKVKALADLEKAQACDLSKANDRLTLAAAWMDAGELTKTREHLQALVGTEAKNFMLWNAWAELARRSNDTAEMKMVADKGTAELPAGAFLPVATELYILAGELDKAQTCIEDFRKQDLSSGRADYLQGLLAEKKQQWPAAIQFWQKAVAQGIQSETIYLKLARSYEQLGDSVSAVQQLKNLVRENEKSVLGQLTLARLLVELGRTEEAAEAAQAAVRLAPSSAEALMVQAQVRQQMMQKGLAPNDPKAWDALAREMESLDKSGSAGLNGRLMRMQAAIYQRQWDTAAKILEGLKKEFPDDVRVAMASVDLQLSQQKTDGAIAELRQVVQKFPQSLIAVRYLGGLLYLQKQADAAIAVLTEAIGRFPSAADKRELTLMLASIYGQTGQSPKGHELLQKLAGEMPDDILLKRELVTAMLAQAKPEDAQTLVDAIKTLEGESGWQWRFEQARVWFYGKDFTANYPKIVPLIKENLAANPDDQASRMLLGDVYKKGGDKQLAVVTFREALARDPDNPEIISATVLALYNASQDDQAKEILAQAQRRKPKDKEMDPRLAHLQLQGFLRQGNLTSAAAQLQAMMDKNPDNQQDRLALAIVRIQQRQFDEAEKLLAEIRKAQPDSLAAASLMIDMRIAQNKPDDAVAIATQLVETAKIPEAYLLRGRVHLRLKNIDAAKTDMLKAVELTPDKAQGWLYQVDFYGTTNDLPQAIKAVREALALSPDDLEVIRRAIILLQSSTDPADAQSGADLLEKSLVKFPKDARLVLMKTRNLLAAGTKTSHNQAIELLKTLTREQPDAEQAWVTLSRAYLMRGDSANATDTTMRGLASLPRSVDLMMSKAACEGYRTPSLAIPTYQLICQKFPDNTEAALSLVNAYLQANDTRSALEVLGSWKDKPQGADQPRFELALAAATWQSGDTAAAQKLFDALYAQRPDDPAVLLVHADSIARGQKWPELVTLVTQWYAKHPTLSAPIVSFLEPLATRTPTASKEVVEPILRKMLGIKPDCVDALAALGVMLQSTGHPTEAQPLYEKAIQLDPGRVTVLNNLAWILCEDLKQYDRALPLANQAIQKRPDYFDAYDTRGVIYYRLNQLDNSQSDLARCIDEFGSGSAALTGAYFHQGRTLFAMQRRLESMQALRKALDLNSQTQSLSSSDLDEIKRMMEELSK